MRVVFEVPGPPPAYRVFRGRVLKVVPAPGRPAGRLRLLLDWRTVALWDPQAGCWAVPGGAQGRRRVLADRMYCDELPYTLEGREWPMEERAPAPCVFCGQRVWHINDPAGRGTAWTLGVRVNGNVRQYLYCNRPECNNEHVWTCVRCSVDTVGPRCCECGGARAKLDRAEALARGENV